MSDPDPADVATLTIEQPPVLSRPPRLAGIVWGAPKTGKTTYLGSSPGKKWIINTDPEGYLALAHRDDYELWDLSDLEPEQMINTFMSIGSRLDKADIAVGDTVLFDSCTVVNQAALLTAIKHRVGASERGRKDFEPSLETPGISAYGARTQYLIAIMGAVLRATRRKGAHCWFTAHEDTPERNEKGEFLYQSILLSDNAVNQSSAAISEIWRMSEKDNARTVQIRSTGTHKPMGTRIFRTEEAKQFKLKYDIEKPDLDQPMSIASLWKAYIDGGMKKLHVPE